MANNHLLTNDIGQIANDYISQQYIDRVRKSKLKKINFYYDSGDVTDMILGIPSIHDENDILDTSQFDSIHTLVQALTYFGHIKNIKVLPPHQDEIANFISLKASFNKTDKLDLDNNINELLNYVGFKNKNSELKDNLENVVKIYNNLKHKAIELYKASYLLFKHLWNERAKYILGINSGDPIIQLDNEVYDFNNTISSKVFKNLETYFKSKRPKKTKSNFRDALSLTLIHLKLTDYLNGSSQFLPIFYSSAPLINALNENQELSDLFSFPINNDDTGNKFSVLRGDTFLLLDVIFDLENDNDTFKNESELFKRISDLKEKIGSDFNNLATDNRIKYELQEIINDKFFHAFWFENMVESRFSETILNLVEYEKIESETSLSKIIAADQKKISNTLTLNLKKLNLIENTWFSIDTFDVFIEKRIKKKEFKIDVFTELSMTRFSLIRCDEIQTYVNSLINEHSKKDQTKYRKIKANIVNDTISGIFERDFELLLTSISVFWVFESYDYINKTLKILNYNYGNYYQLAIFHAAAVIKAYKKVDKRVQKITKCLDDKRIVRDNYKTKISLAYLYFLIWENKYNTELIPIKDKIEHKELELSLTYITEALIWLKEHKDLNKLRKRKYYYCLNNFIYYTTRSCSDEKFKLLEFNVEELRQCSNARKNDFYWQPTFAHTLALYYYRKSLLTKDKVLKIDSLNKAENWIKIYVSTNLVDGVKFEQLKYLIKSELDKELA